ncbi:hypothetical protein L210DRAFT_3143060 [Boletus edulis BED1]|uniref:Uncharacterized protein n=1 Tax=Boletus edulis BED1 TaxID=1328754 RepID=A0AAD4BYJ4_BOLED|nr:hypothetical protein L210DRAFT_3143060 [Boletus edulis BED1]
MAHASVYPSPSSQGRLHSTPPLDPTSPPLPVPPPPTQRHRTAPPCPTRFHSLTMFVYHVVVPHLLSSDYLRKPVGTVMNPLKTAPGTLTDLPEPKPLNVYRGPPGNLGSLVSTTKDSLKSFNTLYPLLLPEDSHLKLPSLRPDAGPLRLPPITETYRSHYGSHWIACTLILSWTRANTFQMVRSRSSSLLPCHQSHRDRTSVWRYLGTWRCLQSRFVDMIDVDSCIFFHPSVSDAAIPATKG